MGLDVSAGDGFASQRVWAGEPGEERYQGSLTVG